LYIASDAAKSSHDRVLVDEVRNFIRSLDYGFSEVIPLFREDNLGGQANILLALKEVFADHDSLIVLEDDVLVGAGFLGFMNSGLSTYKDNPRVIGVSAYLPPDIVNADNEPFMLSMRTPYGIGLWREKEDKLIESFSIESINSAFKDFYFLLDLKRTVRTQRGFYL